MLFNSLDFIVFLPVVLALHWLIPFRYRWILLLIASYFFYMYQQVWYGILLAGTTLIDYFTSQQIVKTHAQKAKLRWLVISIISNIGALVAFKYVPFIYNTGIGLSNALADSSYSFMQNIAIPAGLSFYTFQSLSYSIDVYRGNSIPEKNPFRFALFVSFFPQLVAGPVERFNKLMPQFSKASKLNASMISAGLKLIAWGFFKKLVVADRVAQFIDPAYNNVEAYSATSFIICGFFFALQVYCDFSGYTDIATGVARLFGYNLSINWRRPLLAGSLHSFWKRHHITMTNWFRDYLYIPLGGNRVRMPRWLLNVFLVFLISGLWHGASWTFVIWGACHGLLYVVEILFMRYMSGIKKLKLFGWPYLMTFYIFSLFAFRANSVEDLMLIYEKVFTLAHNWGNAFTELKLAGDSFPLLLAVAASAFVFIKDGTEELRFAEQYPKLFNALRPWFYILVILSIFTIGVFSTNEFIYFQF